MARRARTQWTRGSRPCRGFTLVEMMTASFILTLILGAIFATFTVGNRSMTMVEDRTQLYQTTRLVAHRMYQDLSSIWAPFPDPGLSTESSATSGATPTATAPASTSTTSTAQQTPPFQGLLDTGTDQQTARIEFLAALAPSMTTDSAPKVNVALVSYYIDSDPATREAGLVRAENRYVDLGDPQQTTHIEEVAPEVVDLQAKYYDQTNDQWVDQWDSQTPPRAVTFTITVVDPKDHEAPIVLPQTVTFPEHLGEAVGSSLKATTTGTLGTPTTGTAGAGTGAAGGGMTGGGMMGGGAAGGGAGTGVGGMSVRGRGARR